MTAGQVAPLVRQDGDQLVVGQLSDRAGGRDDGTLVAYLLAVLILVPAAKLWAMVERTRFGIAVIVIACLAVPAMTMRAQQVWDAGLCWLIRRDRSAATR